MIPRTARRRARRTAVAAPLSVGCPLLALLLALLLGAPRAAGQQELSLNGAWTVWLDPADAGLADGWAADLGAGRRPAGAPGEPLTVTVPGALEADPAARGYDGVSFHVHELEVPPHAEGALLSLHFGQVNWACRAWLDGVELGAHEGGYDAFEFDLTGRAAPGRHRLVLRVTDPGAAPVDGVTLRTTPHAKESWYENFGGVVGPVSLRIDRELRLSGGDVRADGRTDARTDTLSVRGTLELSPAQRAALAPPAHGAGDNAHGAAGNAHDAAGHARGTLSAPPTISLGITVDGVERLTLELPTADGRADFDARIELPDAARWSPEHPVLHEVRVSAGAGGAPRELLVRRVGLRTLELRDGDLLIDGVRRVLKGVLWQPHFIGTGGVTPPDAELEAEVRAMLDAGFNLVRAHVRPAPPAFLDACDRLGLLVLEEPAIGWVDDDPALLPRLRHELDWMVARDAHHPSIILWGVLNELSGKGYRYAEPLVAHLASLDDSRPILEDSGGFFGDGRVLPPRAMPGTAPSLMAMLDRHEYPPYPLSPDDRDRLLALGAATAEAPAPQLLFISEFGYGTLVDSVTAAAGFAQRELDGDERVRFQSGAAVERRAAQTGATWTDTHWRAEADRNEADAAEDMVEALRANPAVDLLCYTQWRAVSSESSAGALAPWGEDRPARERLRHALRPLMAVAIPAHLSVDAGAPLTCALVVVNDSGAPARGTLALHVGMVPPAGAFATFATFATAATSAQGADMARDTPTTHAVHPVSPEPREADAPREFPPGVTRVERVLAAPGEAGTLELIAELRLDDGRSERSSARHVAVCTPAAVPGAPGVWRPGDDPAALAAADAVLIARPEALASELTLDARIALWRWVAAGGHAVVLLRNPGEAPLGQLLGLTRGIETFAALPLRAAVGSAPGNFTGRLFLRRRDDGVQALGRDDALLSPRAMLVGELPEDAVQHMLAVGPLGNRIGVPDASVPFGRGALRFTGLPLRATPSVATPLTDAPADARTDEPAEPLRRRVLAELLGDAAQRTRARRAEPAAEPVNPTHVLPTAAQREALESRFDALAQVAAFGDRASPWQGGAGGPQLPPPIALAFTLHDRAWAALLDGHADDALALLDRALEVAGWQRGQPEWLAVERDVLDGLSRCVATQELAAWDAAYDAAELWVKAVIAWSSAVPARGRVDVSDAHADADAEAEAPPGSDARALPGLDELLAARQRLAAR